MLAFCSVTLIHFLEDLSLNLNINDAFFSEIESVPTIDVYTTQDNTKSKVLVQEAKQAIEKSDSSPHYR
jgi:hypothetical protein